MWDLLNQLYKRFGLWTFLFIALAFGTVWVVLHIVTPPCEQVSVFGIIKYPKSCEHEGKHNQGDATKCRELRQHFENNNKQQDAQRREIKRLESAASRGDVHARSALEKSFERLKALEQQGNEIKRQMDRNC
jgi:hypothetical protein